MSGSGHLKIFYEFSGNTPSTVILVWIDLFIDGSGFTRTPDILIFISSRHPPRFITANLFIVSVRVYVVMTFGVLTDIDLCMPRAKPIAIISGHDVTGYKVIPTWPIFLSKPRILHNGVGSQNCCGDVLVIRH